MRKSRTRYICIVVINIILLTSCASSPTGRSQMILKSDAALEQEGSRQFKQLRETLPLVQNPATIDYVAVSYTHLTLPTTPYV